MKITMSGNLLLQVGSEAKPSPLPIPLDLDYTEKSMNDYSWPTPQTNLALNQGTVTSPRFIFVEVTEGAVTLSTNIAGSGPVTLSANPTPSVAGDYPARLMLFTYAPAAAQYYVTTTAPSRARIWFFE